MRSQPGVLHHLLDAELAHQLHGVLVEEARSGVRVELAAAFDLLDLNLLDLNLLDLNLLDLNLLDLNLLDLNLLDLNLLDLNLL